jgi:chromosome segregation protein
MKIKEIKLFGFKSFREETKVLLDTGVTAFVGPNGSGKSNIFDALRWVFGEQSMKALRCERIEDLIYVSSDSKEDSNFTEVAVTIDNEEYFPQFGSEFEIKRRFYRTGDSEFFLNRVKCRLQDIQALFLNSGALTYSFLELAEVERIIHGNTKEMFDDVAGILKYQERKEQTKRRLAATEQDLLRLEDIISEMQRGLRSLKRQVRQARLYNELRAEYKNLVLYTMASEFKMTLEEIGEIQSQIDAKEAERQNVLQAVKQLENEREELKKAIEKTESDKQSSLEQMNQLNNTIDALQNAIAEKEEEVRSKTILSERMLASIEEKQETVKADRRRLESLEGERKAISAKLESMRSDLSSVQEKRDAKDQECFSIENLIKANDKDVAGALRETIEKKNELARLKYDKENKEKLLSRTGEELVQIKGEIEKEMRAQRGLQQEYDEVVQQQDAADSKLRQLHEQADLLTEKLSAAENDLRDRNEAMVDCRVTIDALKRRLQTEGKKEIESKFGKRVAGMFKDNIRVTSGYESFVDICLSDILDFYLLKKYSEDDLENCPEGRFGFIDLSHTTGADTRQEIEYAEPMVQFVEFASAASALTRYIVDYYLVTDHVRARELSLKYPDCGFVTRTGMLFKNGMIVVEKGEVGYFKITHSLEEYKEKLESLRNEVLFVTEEKKRLQGEIEKANIEIEEGRNNLFTVNVKKSECSLKLQDATKLVEKRTEELNSVKQDSSALSKACEDAAAKIRDLGKEIEGIEQRKVFKEQENEQHAERIGQVKQELVSINENVNGLTTEIAVLEGRENIIVESTEQLRKRIAEEESEIESLKEKSLPDNLTELNDAIGALKKELAEKRQEKLSYEAQLPAQLMDEYSKRQSLLYDQLAQKQKDHEVLQDKIMQLKYQLFEKNHRRDELARKADDDFDVVLSDYTPEEAIADASDKAAEVRGRIEKLGEVNPLSLQAFEDEKKRLDEFVDQRDDIIAAKKNLMKSIEELDQRARDRFNETFQDVRKQFNFVFANFFEDGQADLMLTDPDNPLASKVEIVIRMMGRRLKTINQLSGGQKTLLAISLLLAFYLVKPAPFCILDEIDAPLDDINVVRFNKFLRDLSQRTQVVIITHNRATMEYADYLYGLTMERPRESKVISAKLADLEKITQLEE